MRSQFLPLRATGRLRRTAAGLSPQPFSAQGVAFIDGTVVNVACRRKVFAAGVALFTVASAWCGIAPNIRQLILARGLHRSGGKGMLMNITLLKALMVLAPGAMLLMGFRSLVYPRENDVLVAATAGRRFSGRGCPYAHLRGA